MTLLEKPKLGTDPKSGWRYYSAHMAATYVLRETLLVANYLRCIELAIDQGERTRGLVNRLQQVGLETKADLLTQTNSFSKWASQIEQEGFHEIYIHAFISLWSSFEAGIENIVADYVRNDRSSATTIVKEISTKKFQMSDWPWPEEKCLRVARRAERCAIDATPDGKKLFFKRLQTLLSWIGIDINIEESLQLDLAEAKCVRDILLHRYGQVGPDDAAKFPGLKEFMGRTIPFDKGRFQRYSGSVSKTLSAIILSAGQSERAEPNN